MHDGDQCLATAARQWVVVTPRSPRRSAKPAARAGIALISIVTVTSFRAMRYEQWWTVVQQAAMLLPCAAPSSPSWEQSFSRPSTFAYGMVFLDGATQEPAFRLVIGGTLLGGLLGLLVAAMTRPSGTQRLIVLGAVGGLLAGLVYGVIGLEAGACGPGFDHGFCGWVFLGRLFAYPWMPIALWTVFGGSVGAMLAWIAALFAQEKEAAPTASGGLA